MLPPSSFFSNYEELSISAFVRNLGIEATGTSHVLDAAAVGIFSSWHLTSLKNLGREQGKARQGKARNTSLTCLRDDPSIGCAIDRVAFHISIVRAQRPGERLGGLPESVSIAGSSTGTAD